MSNAKQNNSSVRYMDFIVMKSFGLCSVVPVAVYTDGSREILAEAGPSGLIQQFNSPETAITWATKKYGNVISPITIKRLNQSWDYQTGEYFQQV